MDILDAVPRFKRLFKGLPNAFGTGSGGWIKRPPRDEDWLRHLRGQGSGMGIAPLTPDSTVHFAAIDLDEPNFDAALDMADMIGRFGQGFVERSRSGNAHVWVFFKEPVAAWIPMGVLKEITLAAGKPHIEVFPKNHDFTKVRVGNYINLPYHGDARKILWPDGTDDGMPLEVFIAQAEQTLNDPTKWERRADWMLLSDPGKREAKAEFGQQNMLHMCAEHILSGDAGVITHGHQNAVLFSLARCLTNWKDCEHDEALMHLQSAAEEIFDPKPSPSEVARILANVERGQYTSTGCDDPLVMPFAHPDCPIAHPRSR